MEKPTLEEVKEYFKDALKVEDNYGQLADLNNLDERGIHEWAGSYWVFDNDVANVVVWSKKDGYSKIIEYNIPPYNHNHSEERKELDYDNLDDLGKLQIDYTFLQSDFTDFVKKVGTVVKFGRSIESKNGTANIILNKLESIIDENENLNEPQKPQLNIGAVMCRFSSQILIKMKELKKMIIDNLCSEYPIEEATVQVNNAEIIIKGETVRVIYNNGKSDLFKLVVSERLELVS